MYNSTEYPSQIDILIYNNWTQSLVNEISVFNVYPEKYIKKTSNVDLLIPSGSQAVYDLKDFYQYSDLEGKLVDGKYIDSNGKEVDLDMPVFQSGYHVSSTSTDIEHSFDVQKVYDVEMYEQYLYVIADSADGKLWLLMYVDDD